jgi:hypothetical protein
MSQQPDHEGGFAGVGEVVEILEGVGERRAKVMLDSGLVLDVTVESAADVHLGDRVVVEGCILVERLRATASDAVPARRA